MSNPLLFVSDFFTKGNERSINAKKNIVFKIHLVGGYEFFYKNNFIENVIQLKLDDFIIYHGVLIREKLIELLKNCHFNISV